jgi:Cytochrome c7 and related cytochrome c/Class III cytochrome C family
MAQLFHPRSNTIARASIAFAVLLLVGLVWGVTEINLSSYMTRVQMPRDQPVPFSHKHHVSGLGLDCRYCHTSVETSAFAGMPPTETCITCHSQIWSDSPMLEPVRASWRENQSIHWARVHDLPGFVYFNHSIHINKGIGCQTCHGRVDLMPLMWKVNSLHMGWCLDCHRNPERFIRPKSAVFQMDYQPPQDQESLGKKLVAEYKVRKLEDCYTCHR